MFRGRRSKALEKEVVWEVQCSYYLQLWVIVPFSVMTLRKRNSTRFPTWCKSYRERAYGIRRETPGLAGSVIAHVTGDPWASTKYGRFHCGVSFADQHFLYCTYFVVLTYYRKAEPNVTVFR